ncbi:MAG: flagellar export chaperone FliS [Gammaproteobacteria bacterium 39-13]|nr:flagellar export chaperone FliS [Gammaproteobacteria bacterium]OJV86597.1 MAG: flagellar export chaperone FliS [Gammaproteobacteria bacterium 39-13]
MNPNNAAKHYQTVFSQTSIVDADPHRLIQVLMESTLEKLSLAKGFMQRNNIHDKGVNISLALSMIEALQTSLDKEKGAEIAENLFELYDYMMRSLLEANLQNDTNKIDEVIKLLLVIKDAWDNAPKQLQKDSDE